MDLGIISEQPTSLHVVALPYPARGHINPMMNLCRSLVLKGPHILITFVVTEEWLSLISSEQKPHNVHFRTIPNVLLLEKERAGRFPAFFEGIQTKMEGPVEQLLNQLEPPVMAIIADSYLEWAVKVAIRKDIPIALLWTMSAPMFCLLHNFDLVVKNGHFPVDLKGRGEERLEYIPGVASTRVADLPMCLHDATISTLPRVLECIKSASKAQFLLLCSIYELEAQAIDALKQNLPLPIYPIGPTIPYFKLKEENANDYVLEWLDKQPTASALYVSQGSIYSASSAQLEELAAGLRDSGLRYLWVARGDASFFEEFCGERGIIVPWCDQLRVLCHSSVGGFWSHCGWGSTSEAVFAGVPMLAYPLVVDQAPNSKIIVENWKIGWRVKSRIGEEKLVTRDEIAGLIRRFMDVESEEGKEMRRRAKELSEISHRAIREGGSSDTNISTFISEISQHRTI